MPCVQVIELGMATHVMKEHGDMERWPHDHKEMKHEVKIMVIDEEQSYQGKGINIVGHAARGPLARPAARHFGPARARHGPRHRAVPGPPPWPVARLRHGPTAWCLIAQ